MQSTDLKLIKEYQAVINELLQINARIARGSRVSRDNGVTRWNRISHSSSLTSDESSFYSGDGVRVQNRLKSRKAAISKQLRKSISEEDWDARMWQTIFPKFPNPLTVTTAIPKNNKEGVLASVSQTLTSWFTFAKEGKTQALESTIPDSDYVKLPEIKIEEPDDGVLIAASAVASSVREHVNQKTTTAPWREVMEFKQTEELILEIEKKLRIRVQGQSTLKASNVNKILRQMLKEPADRYNLGLQKVDAPRQNLPVITFCVASVKAEGASIVSPPVIECTASDYAVLLLPFEEEYVDQPMYVDSIINDTVRLVWICRRLETLISRLPLSLTMTCRLSDSEAFIGYLESIVSSRTKRCKLIRDVLKDSQIHLIDGSNENRIFCASEKTFFISHHANEEDIYTFARSYGIRAFWRIIDVTEAKLQQDTVEQPVEESKDSSTCDASISDASSFDSGIIGDNKGTTKPISLTSGISSPDLLEVTQQQPEAVAAVNSNEAVAQAEVKQHRSPKDAEKLNILDSDGISSIIPTSSDDGEVYYPIIDPDICSTCYCFFKRDPYAEGSGWCVCPAPELADANPIPELEQFQVHTRDATLHLPEMLTDQMWTRKYCYLQVSSSPPVYDVHGTSYQPKAKTLFRQGPYLLKLQAFRQVQYGYFHAGGKGLYYHYVKMMSQSLLILNEIQLPSVSCNTYLQMSRGSIWTTNDNHKLIITYPGSFKILPFP